MTLEAPRLTSAKVPMLFTATDDAVRAASLVRFVSSDPKGRPLVTQFEQTVFYGLDPPNYAFFGVDSERLAVAVAEDYPVSLELEPIAAPLVQEGETVLRIRTRVGPNQRRPVRLSMLYKPTGISAELSEKVAEGEHVVEMRLEANRETSPGRWPIAVVSREATQLRGGGVSTQLRTLEVLPAFLDLVLTRAILARGKTVPLKAQLEQKVEFRGKAIARLEGLPKGVTAKPVAIDASDESVTFQVTATGAAPVGLHKTLSCRVSIPWQRPDGQLAAVVHRLGQGGQLRILEAADVPGQQEQPQP